MLEVKELTKKYKKEKAVDNVSFNLNEGEISILLGANGAGKSTIIKSIVGLLRYDGTITIDGLNNKSIEAKKTIGYVPEIPSLYDALTVYEHLEFIRRAYKVKDKEIINKLLERFNLMEVKKKTGKELSKGMQQKVSICCALLHNPKVVIFDEPMVGLDPYAIKELKEIFNELKRDGKIILISTHMIDTIEENWDVAYIMKKGLLKAIKYNKPDSDAKTLEETFFEIMEG